MCGRQVSLESSWAIRLKHERVYVLVYRSTVAGTGSYCTGLHVYQVYRDAGTNDLFVQNEDNSGLGMWLFVTTTKAYSKISL